MGIARANVGLYSISTTAKPIYKVHIVPSQSRSLQRELFVGRFNGIVADLMEFQRAVELGIGAAVESDYIGSTSSATLADISQYRMTAQSSISNRHAYITNPHLTNQSINQQTSKGPLKTQIPSMSDANFCHANYKYTIYCTYSLYIQYI